MESEHHTGVNGLGWRKAVACFVIILVFTGGAFSLWWSAKRAADKPETDPAPGTQTAPVATTYQPPSDEGYVGTAACAECHSEIAESYKSHPMFRSLRRVDVNSDDATLPLEQRRVVGKQRIFEVEIHDNVMLHHERMFDVSGELIYDHAVEMDFVVGSGRRAKAYLHQRGNQLFMSPLNLYTRSQKWDLAPGYVDNDPRRFDRRVTDECLSCHAGRVAAAGRLLNKYQTPAFHEMSIGCESCHGPGKPHVTLRESNVSVQAGKDPIVNPARLDHERRESICYQCHLPGAVRLPRYGRSDLDFRPGNRLEDIWTVLTSGTGVTEDGRTMAVNHVEQMRASRCYTQSEDRLGCISCHDPHSVPLETERAAFYREKCFNCHHESSCSLSHDRRKEKDNSCIACHMPARKASNISHVSQTDHRIIRTLGQTLGQGTSQNSDTLSFFNKADLRLDSWEQDRAMGLGAWMYLSKKGRRRPADLANFLVGVLEKVPNDGTTLTVLGSMAMDNQFTNLARGYYETARKIPAAEEAALSGLLKIHYLSADWENALDYANRLIEIDTGNARAHAMRADILGNLGKRSEGIEAARRALEFNPTLIPVRQWLVETYRTSGRTAEQREQQQIILRMQNARPPQGNPKQAK